MVIQLTQTASNLRNTLVNCIADSMAQFKHTIVDSRAQLKYPNITTEKKEVSLDDLHIKDAGELENAITRAISDIANNENIDSSTKELFTAIADEALRKNKEDLMRQINLNIDSSGGGDIRVVLKSAIKEAIDPLIDLHVGRQALMQLKIDQAKSTAEQAKSIADQAKAEVTKVRADANEAKAYANQVANTKPKLGIGCTSLILGAACVALVVLAHFNKLPPVVSNQVPRLEMCAAVFIILGIVSLTEKLLTPCTQLAQSHANTAVPHQQSKV